MKLTDNKQRLLFWLLAILAVFSLLLFLGSTLFNTKGEPREAVVAMSMLQSGDWVSPINNGVDIAYKPPFFHWCIALCSLLTGGVTEFTSRFPSAVATIVMVLAAYWYMLRSKVDCRLAFLTGVVTLTAFEVHRASMACRVDMMLSALTVIALYSLHRWYVSRIKWQIPVAVLSLSGAFLTKGPVGALLPCMVMGVYMLLRGEKVWRAFLYCLSFVLLASILPLCWYYMAYLERGDSFMYLVYEENVLRLMGKMVYSSHDAPAIYNVVTMLAGFLPYTLLLVLLLFAIKYPKPNFSAGIGKMVRGWWSRLRGMSDQELLALLSAVLVFVFYCIPKSKRSVYLLPVYPFVSYFIAKYMLWLASCHRRVVRAYGWVLSVLAILLPVLLFVIKLGIVPHGMFHGKHATENLAYLVALENLPMGVAMAFVVLLALFSVWLFSKSCRGAVGSFRLCSSLGGLVFAVYLMLDGVVLPQVLNVKSDYPVAEEISRLVPSGSKIWDYRSDWQPGERNRMHQFTVNFYLGDRIVPLDAHKPSSGYLIMGDDDAAAFAAGYPKYRLRMIKRFGHKSCDDKRRLTLYSFTNK